MGNDNKYVGIYLCYVHDLCLANYYVSLKMVLHWKTNSKIRSFTYRYMYRISIRDDLKSSNEFNANNSLETNKKIKPIRL